MAESTVDWFDEDQMAIKTVSRTSSVEKKFKEIGARAGHTLINYSPSGRVQKDSVAQAYCAACHLWFFHGKKLQELVGRCGDAPKRGVR